MSTCSSRSGSCRRNPLDAFRHARKAARDGARYRSVGAGWAAVASAVLAGSDPGIDLRAQAAPAGTHRTDPLGRGVSRGGRPQRPETPAQADAHRRALLALRRDEVGRKPRLAAQADPSVLADRP